jgi:hypothetical protein
VDPFPGGERVSVIFLDIDGVLCTAKAHVAYSTQMLWRHYDPVSTRLVAKLAREAKAEIVLSSTWRMSFELMHMTAILMNAGFEEVPWHTQWKTPNLYNLSRGEEIKKWFENAKADSYVILDDDSDILEEQKPFFVQTDEFDGFGFRDYLKAKKILGVK